MGIFVVSVLLPAAACVITCSVVSVGVTAGRRLALLYENPRTKLFNNCNLQRTRRTRQGRLNGCKCLGDIFNGPNPIGLTLGYPAPPRNTTRRLFQCARTPTRPGWGPTRDGQCEGRIVPPYILAWRQLGHDFR